jgi:ArsR family transcriptional regulator
MIEKLTLDNDTINEQAALFAALADPTRLKLLQILCRQNPPGCRCVINLSDLLGVTQSAVSQHLRVLKSVDLVTSERRGYRIHYSVKPEALKRIQNFVLSALETPEACKADCCQEQCPVNKTN